MEIMERHPTVMNVPSGKVPLPPDGLIEATRARNTSSQSQSGPSTPSAAVTRALKTKRPTDDNTSGPALKGSTDGTTTRTDQAAASNSQASVANIGRSTKPTRSVVDAQGLEYVRKRDRLLSLNFQTSQKIALNEDEKFPEEYKENVRRLSKYLAEEPLKFQGAGYLTLMQCMGKRTEPKDALNTLVPYIRIMGLTTHEAIKAMHILLSKSRVRSLYHPHIRICYDLSKIAASAAIDAITVHGPPPTTLCGTLTVIKHGNVERTVTIGGLIKVAGRFYAITTSHVVPNISEEPSRESSNFSDDLTIDDNDYDDDVEPALVIERGLEDLSLHDELSSQTLISTQAPASVNFGVSTILGRLKRSGPEWSLIGIENPLLQLPNFAANEGYSKHETENTILGRSYISRVAKLPLATEVTVLSGTSGQVKAKLSPNEAYTRLPSGTFVQTWTLSFEGGTGLKKGDSGSWVVDPTTGFLYGHVIAISTGCAFIRPTTDVFCEIDETSGSGSAQMPTPFDLLADLSRLRSRADLSKVSSKISIPASADVYAKQSIASNALLHSHQSPPAKIIQAVLLKQSSVDEAILCKILRTTGSDIIGALRNPQIWDSARKGAFGEQDSTFRLLRSLSQEAGLPQINRGASESGGPQDEISISLDTTAASPMGRWVPAYFRDNQYTGISQGQKTSPARSLPLNKPRVPRSGQVASLNPPFSERIYLPSSLEDSLPTIAGRGRDVFFASDDMAAFLREDLDLKRLNHIHDYLWLAGRPMRARPIHRYKMFGLEIRCTQQMDLHLLRTSTYLILKPLPLWIFDRDLWYQHMDRIEEWESATGFLISYIWLLTTPIDLKMAIDLGLVHEGITWNWWRDFVKEFLQLVNINAARGVNKRFQFGELRLDRINMIYRCRYFTTHLARGYLYSTDTSVNFVLGNQVRILIAFVFFNLVLNAMQVGSSVPGLGDDRTFQRASYGFVIYSLTSLAVWAGVVVFGFVVYFIFNLYSALYTARKPRIEARQERQERQEKDV